MRKIEWSGKSQVYGDVEIRMIVMCGEYAGRYEGIQREEGELAAIR